MPRDIEISIDRQIYSAARTVYARPMNRVLTIAALGMLVLAPASCTTIMPPTTPEAITPEKSTPQEQAPPAPAPRGPAPRRERLRTVGVDASVTLA